VVHTIAATLRLALPVTVLNLVLAVPIALRVRLMRHQIGEEAGVVRPPGPGLRLERQNEPVGEGIDEQANNRPGEAA
jgi:hypothetical protein